MKPKKITYENQKEVHNLIVKELKSKYLNNAKEAYLIGSLTNGNFGIYDEIYEGYFGSDIDIVIIPLKISKNWKYLGDFYNWHKKYYGGEIKISKTTPPINFMIPFNN